MHISRNAIALAVTAALPALSLVGASDAGAGSKLALGSAVDSPHAKPHFKYPLHAHAATSSVLYDQSGTAISSFASQNFESVYDAYDSAGADDFVVTDSAGWGVSGFNFQISAGSPPGDPTTATYDIDVYPDVNGLPGDTTVCSYGALPGTVDAGITSLSISLPSACNLAQGTYWVSMIVNLDFLVGGQIFWSLDDRTGLGSGAAWENPGDAFGSGCTTWAYATTCGAGNGDSTAEFQVIGSVGVQSVCTPTGICLQSTVGTDLSPNACGAAEAIDATVGDQLNFCYTVTNNTGVELDYQSLANNIDGSLLAFANQPLAAGASYQYNHIETVGQSNTYTSTWTAQDVAPGYAAEVESGGGACTDRIFADGFGDSPAMCGTFVDISGTGTPLGLGDDDSADVAMPFSFTFYGTTSNMLSVSNNGGIEFGMSGGFVTPFNASLPSGSLSAPAILPLWDDFDSESGDVYTDTRGSAPNRQFIVEWYNRVHYTGNTDPATFEVIFNESDGTLQFEYADVSYTGANSFQGTDPDVCDGGVCATIGLQASAALYNQYSAFNASIADNSGIKWTLTSPHVFTSTDSVTVSVGAPDINVVPPSLSGTVDAGGTTSTVLDIQNLGNRDLNWVADEAPPAEFHFPYGPRYAPSTLHAGESDISALRPSADAFRAHGRGQTAKKGTARAHSPLATTPSFGCNITASSSCEYVGFDADAPAALTDVASENELFFASAFVANDFSKEYVVGYPSGDLETVDTATGARTTVGATGQGTAVRTLAFDAMTGTTFGTAIDGSGTDLFTVDTATGAMTLVGPITGLGGTAFVMGLAVDPNTGLMYGIEVVSSALVAIDKTTGAAATIGALGYTTAFSQGLDFDAATHTLYLASIDYATFAQNMYTVDIATGAASIIGPIGNNIAQLSAFGIAIPAGPCSQPADQPWLSIAPSTGTTPGGADMPTTVTIDATSANPGDTLAGTVCVRSNDPDEPVVEVPVSFDVTSPPPPPVPPTVTKSFNPTQVTPGTTSTLTITLANSNATDATLNAALVDSFPGGLVIADTPNAQTTCGGNVTAVPASDSVTLDATGAAIPVNGSCTVTVDVVSSAPSDYPNDIPAGALQTSEGANIVAADATLSVAFAPPTLAKNFAPALIAAGNTSTLVITLGNPNGIDISLTNPLTDAFPNGSGIVADVTPNAQTTCANGSITAAGGDVSVELDGAAVIPAGGTCTVTIDVTSSTVGSFTNSIPAGSLQTTAGINATSADATLKVTP
ncbi:MAG TPA: hypothetical protein VFV97_12500 [Rhodanobacteraceae bacterium]|nr:hypothetical protein [Rhodanobacteraceae bacterium]